MLRFWDSTGYWGDDIFSIRIYKDDFWIGDLIFTSPEAHKIRISHYKITHRLV